MMPLLAHAAHAVSLAIIAIGPSGLLILLLGAWNDPT